MIRRREFITLLGPAGAVWSGGAWAQQGERMRRIGVLTGVPETDTDARARNAAFREELQKLGWTEGRNVRLDYRWGSGGNRDLRRRYVAELVALAPDVIVVGGAASTEALQQASQTIPIVFLGLADPVGAGFVESLARPGGNTTGLGRYDAVMGLPDLFTVEPVK